MPFSAQNAATLLGVRVWPAVKRILSLLPCTALITVRPQCPIPTAAARIMPFVPLACSGCSTPALSRRSLSTARWADMTVPSPACKLGLLRCPQRGRIYGEQGRADRRDSAGRHGLADPLYQSRAVVARFQRTGAGGSGERAASAAGAAALRVDLGEQPRRV